MNSKDRDAFFTLPQEAEAVVAQVMTIISEARAYELFEPSAGGGAFIDAAKAQGFTIRGVDIHPMRDDILQEDFLTSSHDLSGKIVLGNPPFGSRNNLAIAFINKSFSLGASYVAFILPASIIAWSYLKQLRHAEVCYVGPAGNEFEVDGHREKIFKALLVIFKRTSREKLSPPVRTTFFHYYGHLEPYEAYSHIIIGPKLMTMKAFLEEGLEVETYNSRHNGVVNWFMRVKGLEKSKRVVLVRRESVLQEDFFSFYRFLATMSVNQMAMGETVDFWQPRRELFSSSWGLS